MTPTEFMDKVLLHWPPFRWEEEQEKAWSEDLVKEVHGFSATVRKRAAETMIRTRPRRAGTPGVADCVSVCVEARRWLEREEGKGQLPIGPALSGGDWSPERIKLAYDLCHTEMGRQAARMGWVLRLWNFCRVHQRHPGPMEIDKLKREAAEHKQLVAECHKGNGGALSASLAKLGDSMLAKEQRITAEVLGVKD